MRRENILLLFIVILATFIRFWQINSNPPGPHADEADMGYAAYSILKTGLTQYGDFNPLAFREFNGGTFPPLYSYTLIPFLYLFGLDLTVERLPASLFGIATIPIFFLLLKKLFQSSQVALVGSFLLAVNPWHVFLSRQGLLETIAVFLVLSGVLTFFYGKNKNYMYGISAFCFGLSLHANDAPKIVIPILIVLLVIFEWKTLKKVKKYFFTFLVVFFIFYTLMLKVLFFDNQIGDFNRVSSLESSEVIKTVNMERQVTNAPLWLSRVFHNKLTVAAKHYLSDYLRVYSFSWFFVDGHGNLQESVGRHGQFYLFELPFFFLGLYLSFKNKKIGFLLLSWLFIANIPGGITKGEFYPYRSVLMLPIPLMFSSLGIVWVWKYFSKNLHALSFIYKSIFLAICCIYIASFLFTYFFDYPVYASEWRYKQRNEVLKYTHSIEVSYYRIFVNGGVEWAVMHAFNAKVPPEVFQNAYKHKKKYKGIEVITIGKFSFGSFSQSKIATPSAYFPKKSLFVLDGADYPGVESFKVFPGADPLRLVYKVLLIR